MEGADGIAGQQYSATIYHYWVITRNSWTGKVINSGIPIELSQRTDRAVKEASNPPLKLEWGAHIVGVLFHSSASQLRARTREITTNR